MFARNRADRPARKAFQALLSLLFVLAAGHAGAQPDPSASPSAACGTQNLLAGKMPSDQQGLTGEVKRITDSTIDADGAAWDAESAVTWMGSGHVTFDL